MFFGNNKDEQQQEKSREPSESAQVNESSVVQLWIGDNGRLNYDIKRANPSNPEKPFRTKKPEQLANGDLQEAMAFMAHVLSQAPIAEGLKTALAEAAKDLGEIAEKAKERFGAVTPKVNGETKSLLLSLSS